MSGLVVVALVAAGVAAYGFMSVAHGRIQAHGLLVLLWRFLTGQAWHGKPLTDSGWARPGTRALTRTGHATRFQYLPRWRRALWRSGSTLGAFLALYGLWTAPGVTLVSLVVLAAGSAGYGLLRARRSWRERKHNRSWVLPTHVAIAPLLGIPLPSKPGDWLQVEPDRSKATLALPHGYTGTNGKEREQLAAAVAAKLGMEGPDVRWALAGPAPTLTLEAAQPPPASVGLDDLRDAIRDARADELVIGVGRRGQVVKSSLSGDSPHIGLSMASGAGKSVCARFLACQVLLKGGLVLVLDIKRISHAWAKGLPNVGYARTVEQIHRALLWLESEVDRRNEVADVAADVEGEVHANVGPRIFVVAEELNMLQPRLKAHWRSIRGPGDPARSPAQDALDAVLFAGRQVRVNVLEIGQRLSAAATGGGDARENLAVRILGRYSPSVWKLLAGEHAMPPSSRTPGRIQVVDHRVRESQGAYLTGAEAREISLAGEVATPPPSMPYVARPAVGDLDTASIETGPDQRIEVLQPAPVTPPVDAISLRDAIDQGIVSGSLNAIRVARHRHRDTFPSVVGRDGLAELFDADQLAAWEQDRKASR